ncbi:hypothetical protein YC2023_120029 [Brassica napus]
MCCGNRRYTAIKYAGDMETGEFANLSLALVVDSDGSCDFLLGFVFPPLWYYATFLYFGNYYRRDPRERAGLAVSPITMPTCRSRRSFAV